MKKKLLALLLLLAVVFTGCGKKTGSEDVTPTEIAVPTQSALRLLTRSGSCSVNSSGAYSVELLPDGTQLAYDSDLNTTLSMTYFTDFATLQKKPLCSVQGCGHDSPDCPALQSGFGSNLALIAGEDFLLWLRPLHYELADGGLREVAASVSISAPDGSDYQTLLTLESGRTFFDGSVGFDGEYLYLFSNFNMLGGAPSILKLNRNSGAVQTYPLNQPLSEQAGSQLLTRIKGVYNGAFLVEQCRVDSESNKMTDFMFLCVDPTSGAARTIAEFPGEFGSSGMYIERLLPDGQALAVADERTLGRYDLESGSFSEIIAAPESIGRITVFYADERLALLYCEENGVANIPYIADLQNGTMTKSNLVYMNGGFGGIRAVEILGIAGDDYYVLYDDEYYEETAVLDGHPQSYMADHYKYALISRQDYLANIPNYRTVTEVE